jgi:hypothetical protein
MLLHCNWFSNCLRSYKKIFENLNNQMIRHSLFIRCSLFEDIVPQRRDLHEK